ncbi:MAG: hypothetical protein DLM61_23680 [Pseudonocardiales bacterium]|nr:YceI family protein [Pseudonocardiales bacterium]PZS23690.1 MAG: hypothetical protein DLM61_23680 [Pseudonocardiales bacterium]
MLSTPGIWHIDPIHSTVAATAVHLGFAKIHGRFRRFSGTLTVADPPEHSSVDVLIDTDNPDRDTARLTGLPGRQRLSADPLYRPQADRAAPGHLAPRWPAHPEVSRPTCRAEHRLLGHRPRSAGRRPRRIPCQHATRP